MLTVLLGCSRSPSVLVQPEAGERHLRDLRRLTFGGNNAEAYFSPSGRQLIFQRQESLTSGCDQQYVMQCVGRLREIGDESDGRPLGRDTEQLAVGSEKGPFHSLGELLLGKDVPHVQHEADLAEDRFGPRVLGSSAYGSHLGTNLGTPYGVPRFPATAEHGGQRMKLPANTVVTFGVQRVATFLSMSLASTLSAGIAQAQEAADTAEASPKQSYFNWTDNNITLLPYGWGFAVDPDEQSTFTFEHVHDSKIGDLFLFVDATKFHSDAGGGTWYGEISPRLSLGKTLEKDLSFALFRKSLFEVKDVLIAAQYERGEDADVAEAALVGVGFDLDVREAGLLGPLGKFKYIQLNLYARAELAEGVERGFEDMQITMVAARPFTVGSARFLVDGYFDWVLGLGSEDWSYHLNPQLTLDVGKYWGSPDKSYAGIEFDFWWNKYQIPNSSAFDTDQAAVSLMFKYHL